MTEHSKTEERVVFGFWIYILSDCLLFAGLFATFAVLRNATAGGIALYDFLDLKFVLAETIVLLTSNLAMGLALVSAEASQPLNKGKAWPSGLERPWAVAGWLALALILGLVFLGLEVREFASLVAAGHGPDQSAFLSSFFALVGTHGLHVALGSLWLVVVMAHLFLRPQSVMPKLRSLALFWHFLDIVWIFIFTIVYLFGAL